MPTKRLIRQLRLHHLRLTLPVVWWVAGCSAFRQPPPELRFEVRCSYACIDNGVALTAGHCLDRSEEIALVLQDDCEPAKHRTARAGERVLIVSRNTTRESVVVAAHGKRIVLEGIGNLGESGSGVYGEDGALVGIVQRRSIGITEAAGL